MRKTKEEKLKALTEKQAQIAAAQKLVENAIKAEQKRKATRRAMVVGSIVLRDGVPDWVLKLIDEQVSSKTDRALFGLETKRKDGG